MTPSNELKNLTVLVTRPQHQAQALIQIIERSGGQAILFPTLEIKPIEDNSKLLEIINKLNQFDFAIFVSANAVSHVMPLCKSQWPAHLAIIAVGTATAKALASFDLTTIEFPDAQFNSEAILALPQLQHIEGKKIVIFAGIGGRDLLPSVLRARGAEVVKAESYQRVCPQAAIEPVFIKCKQSSQTIIISTSNESLENLLKLAGEDHKSWLCQQPLLVISERMAVMAQQIGFTQIIRAAKPSDEDILAALIKWYSEVFRS